MAQLRSSYLFLLVVFIFCLTNFSARASVYNGQPKLVVVIVIDQFRGDYLDRGHDGFGQGGFRLFTDKGAWFTNCNYEYANPRTAPGHATLFTGAYTNGHGINNNEWWSDSLQRLVTSVEDDSYTIVGVPGDLKGTSPHNLMSSTVTDELRLATDGKSRVFGIGLKDRSSVLPMGFSGIAYWIDRSEGNWVSSSYYMKELPEWVRSFNQSGAAEKYWGRKWMLADKTLRVTTRPPTVTDREGFFEIVGGTPYSNDYEFEFARALIENEKLGQGPATDLLVISLPSLDILSHKVGPNSDESVAMVQELDRQLAAFYDYLARRMGLGNLWLVLCSDHGVSPAPSYVGDLHIRGAYLGQSELRNTLNQQLRTRLEHPKTETGTNGTQRRSVSGKQGTTPAGEGTNYVPKVDWPVVFLNAKAFTDAKVNEADAERMVADFFKPYARGYYTRAQLAANQVPPTPIGRRYLNSLSPTAGWFVYMISPPFFVGGSSGTDHAMPYSYDIHVPLAFYGLPFQPGVYRGACEPTDMAVTLSNLLGINSPSAAQGRVLTEALKPSSTQAAQ
jgi:predicted AlkP superfamily pyrophosphatase or phosphodiesterase